MAQTLFQTQLLRHPNLRAIDRELMYARHPSKTDPSGKRYVPAVNHHPAYGYSVFLYPGTKYGYDDRILADGVTIEYHPSTNSQLNNELGRLVGQEVTLYAQVGKQECRQGKVTVGRPSSATQPVFHLKLMPLQPVARKGLWADMTDSE